MGIDVRSANVRANELKGYASELRAVKDRISAYCLAVNSNWEGKEVSYYGSSITGIERKLERAAAELEAIGRDVSSTANEIWQEEEAERRQREEEERRRREEEERKRREEAERAAVARVSAAGVSGGGGHIW